MRAMKDRTLEVKEEPTKKRVSQQLNPAKIVSLAFMLVTIVGWGLLQLPMASHGKHISSLDALFMAASAVCVTGLSTISIGADLSRFGQWVILALIQIGGLGIMTFSLFFLLFLGRRTSLFSRLSLWKMTKSKDTFSIVWSSLYILLITLSIELVGMLLLLPHFLHNNTLEEAFFISGFHAVSAFCNAGFSLFDDSLMGFSQNPALLSTMMGLIVLGGLGFIVLDELRAYWATRKRRKPFRLSLHTRVALIMTGILIGGGTVLFWVLEVGNTMNAMPVWQQGFNALFLSITSRTAGFNTVDTAWLSPPSLMLLIFLMMVGGVPGSTAGGIKVTTFAVLVAFFSQQARGATQTNLLKRQIPRDIIRDAMVIFFISIAFILSGIMITMILESFWVSRAEIRGKFLEIIFECVSAFGTVGLSTGITKDLSASSKLVMIFLMFCGRVGPLTLALSVLNYCKQSHFEYAEEDVMIG